MARDHMRIAAGPLDARFVHALSNQLATDHRGNSNLKQRGSLAGRLGLGLVN
jgi:hypothetical protein